jgi:uncharacterized membrane protein
MPSVPVPESDPGDSGPPPGVPGAGGAGAGGPGAGGAGGPVWTFRGYRISPSEFNAAMVHFYRGEIYRSQVWRQRLDHTTNWAVLTTGAALTFAFSDPATTI